MLYRKLLIIDTSRECCSLHNVAYVFFWENFLLILSFYKWVNK